MTSERFGGFSPARGSFLLLLKTYFCFLVFILYFFFILFDSQRPFLKLIPLMIPHSYVVVPQSGPPVTVFLTYCPLGLTLVSVVLPLLKIDILVRTMCTSIKVNANTLMCSLTSSKYNYYVLVFEIIRALH